MEEEGMTDLQFKSFLKQVVANLEEAKAAPTKGEMDEKLDRMILRLKSDIES